MGEGVGYGDFFDLGPVFAFVGVTGMQELLVPAGFVAEEQQALGVGIQAADGIDVFGELKFGEGTVGRAVAGELGQHAVGFVKGNEHCVGEICQRRRPGA